MDCKAGIPPEQLFAAKDRPLKIAVLCPRIVIVRAPDENTDSRVTIPGEPDLRIFRLFKKNRIIKKKKKPTHTRKTVPKFLRNASSLTPESQGGLQ